jgi:phosphate/sulfate permease
METFYLLIVIVLFALAISDLIVGVSNDAVNFLNSAVGAKAGKLFLIMVIASAGVVIGATFSSGLMEVARKGIFHPEMFIFGEIMVIFLAVMLTDIILLDFFNTIGLPTSTTVSIVFELLGSAVAVSIIKISANHHTLLDLGNYINTDKALAIIAGILLSVFIAFIVGAIVQYLTRLLFTFKFKKTLKYFGSIWGGLAISAITYFMLIKGAKGASFIPEDAAYWINSHKGTIVLWSFGAWVILLQAGKWLFNLDIPRLIVLVGTFALAMAFAGNDLVNFIGVPLAGLSSYQEYLQQGTDDFMMTALGEPVRSNTLLLLLAGIIMIITLWTSKKARKVVSTTVDLSRQGEGEERFGSSVFSRAIVTAAISVNNTINKLIPVSVQEKIERRFQNPETDTTLIDTEKPAFDMMRAAVNLVIASILIAFGTSLKLPLSTTYVTFMVAMGTSLADRAWGRESAVYRITGVFTVIGGWFMTALTAFLVAGIFATILYFGNIYALIGLVLVALFFVIRTHFFFKKQEGIKKEKALIEKHDEILDSNKIKERSDNAVADIISMIPVSFREVVEGLWKENKGQLKKNLKKVKALDKKTRYLKDDIHYTIENLTDDSITTGHFYVRTLDFLRELAVCLKFISEPSYDHINNHHKGITESQYEDLLKLSDAFTAYYNTLSEKYSKGDIEGILKVRETSRSLLELNEKLRKSQIERIREHLVNTKNSLLYLNLLAEAKNLVLYTNNLINIQREFENQN